MQRLAPGRLLNAQLRLLAWLGEELHGESFLGELRPSGKLVTIKIMHADLCRTTAYHQRFKRSAELALTLSHPHAAQMRAFGALPDAPEEPVARKSHPGLQVVGPGQPWLA